MAFTQNEGDEGNEAKISSSRGTVARGTTIIAITITLGQVEGTVRFMCPAAAFVVLLFQASMSSRQSIGGPTGH